MKFVIYLIIALLLFAIGFISAASRDGLHINEEIQFVQAERVFSDLLLLQEIERYLNAGCVSEANKKIQNETDHHYMYLSEHVRLFPEGKFAEQLSKKNPELLKKIKKYKVDWMKKYVVGACGSVKRTV